MNFLATKIAHAQSSQVVDGVIDRLIVYVIDPIIYFLFVLATAMFIWGVFQYMFNANDPDARAQGQQHILWGVVGAAIMVSVFGIIRFVTSTIGVPAPF